MKINFIQFFFSQIQLPIYFLQIANKFLLNFYFLLLQSMLLYSEGNGILKEIKIIKDLIQFLSPKCFINGC